MPPQGPVLGVDYGERRIGLAISDSEAQLDVTYLARLGSDATPILVERIEDLTEAAQGEVASALLSRWGPDRKWDWRNWNLADWRARQIVKTEAERLRAMVDSAGRPDTPPGRPVPPVSEVRSQDSGFSR